MTKEIDKKAILKKAMNRKYCSRTRFDYLDEEELPMIYNAMEEYHRLASIETEGEIRLLEEREVLWSNKKAQLEEEIERLKELLQNVVTREYSQCNQTDKNKLEVWNKFKTKNNIK